MSKENRNPNRKIIVVNDAGGIGYIATIPANVIKDTSLSPKARWLYVALSAFKDSRTSEANPTVAHLMKEFGFSTNVFYRVRKELMKAGLVRVIMEKNGKSQFERCVYEVRMTKGTSCSEIHYRENHSIVFEGVENGEQTKYPVQLLVEPVQLPTEPEVLSGKIKNFREIWNEEFKGTKVASIREKISTTKTTSFRARFKDDFFVENFKEAIAKIKNIGWMFGKGNRHWFVTLNYFLKPESVEKIIDEHVHCPGMEARHGNSESSQKKTEEQNTEELF